VIHEPRQGYGNALRRGMAEAQGEYIVLAEPDGTFMGKDVLKLLAYADDFDLVLGTRTTRELIWHGANMGWQLRWGNWVVAKLLQVLFGGPSLSDCGCTLRLVRRSAALVYLVLVGRQLGRPLMYDDANFALAARAVAETGLPFGNQGWMSERGDFLQREQWALWHPPLYVYADGLAARLGGWTPPVLRALGVTGGLATAALTYVLAADLTHGPREMKSVAGGLAAALVLVCPLVVQSTLVLDIDFPLLLPLTLLFVLLYARLEGAHRAWLWLAPLFALLLWSKMTNPVALVAVAVE